MQTHALDLPEVITYLGNRSALLRLALPGKKVGVRHPCEGIVVVERGKIQECTIQSAQGIHMQGEQALQLLLPLQGWVVEEKKQPLTSPTPISPARSAAVPENSPAPRPEEAIPYRRITALIPQMLQPFAPRERLILTTIFAMIDGSRSVAELCTLLPYEPDSIKGALGVLQRLAAIEFTLSPRKNYP